MDRRMRSTVVAAVVVMVLLVLAAASAPVDLWATPPSDGVDVALDTGSSDTVEPNRPVGESHGTLPAWIDLA